MFSMNEVNKTSFDFFNQGMVSELLNFLNFEP